MTDDVQKPAEASFYDDPATADLSAKVTEAWAEFARALAEALPALPPGGHAGPHPRPDRVGHRRGRVRRQRQPRRRRCTSGVRGRQLPAPAGAPAVPHRGGRPGRAGLVAARAGGQRRRAVRAELPVDAGAPGWPRSSAARCATCTAAPHPAFLVYPAQTARTTPSRLPHPGRGAADARPRAEGQPHARAGGPGRPRRWRDKVATVVAAMLKTTPDSLQVDKDGDIGIRAGSAMVFVRVRDNPPLVDVFSPVLTEIEPTEQLYVKLSELTNRMPIGRLYCASDTVWASVPVFGRDFQATHLMLAVQVMTGLADELDDRLHGEFGGKRFFGEGDKPGRSTRRRRRPDRHVPLTRHQIRRS